MLLTVDLGNTSIKLGIYDEDKQLAFACFDGIDNNFRSLILSFIFKSNLREDDITAAIRYGTLTLPSSSMFELGLG